MGMKIWNWTIIGGMLLAAAVAAGGALAQDIYKTVDEDGNVVYTDQKPSEDAEPVTLPDLTVVDPVDIGDPSAASSDDRETPDAAGPPLQILSPAAEETIWNTAYRLPVSVSVDGRIPSGAQLIYLVDGEERMTTRAQSIELEEVFRGEHQLSVEMRNNQGDVLSQAGPVTFYMRQHSRLHPNPN
jgi:hypothetical protein